MPISAKKHQLIDSIFNFGGWSDTRKKWALEFFGEERFERVVIELNPIYHRYVADGWGTAATSAFQFCCAYQEMRVNRYPQLVRIEPQVSFWKDSLFKGLMQKKAAMIASIGGYQALLLPHLKELGFKEIDYCFNPNSGNMVWLLMFKFPD